MAAGLQMEDSDQPWDHWRPMGSQILVAIERSSREVQAKIETTATDVNLLHMDLRKCDGQARCGLSVNTTCAGAAGTNPALKEVTANPQELPASKEEPGGLRAEKRTDEKAYGREETDGGVTSSSTGERNFEGRPKPGGECPNIIAVTSVAQEAHSETSSHASGEAWHTPVRPGTGLMETRVVGWGEGKNTSEKET
ncbi:hypothetical protein NDU88_000724 [Pleurodeles waltl]|uniref:Uncharacterized protein n=1 Tax=Pleurodeles waltl TaxID=8319 RepID=A0AAV7KYM1_PLEWA|nr:hypothetical protein NDU88_000724 [Pleurodeles waltl]